MRNVIILGSGGLASELTFYIEDNNSKNKPNEKINILGYIDYANVAGEFYNKYDYEAPIISDIEDYIPKDDEEVLIGIGDVAVRKKMIAILLNKKANIGGFVHHSVIVPKCPNWGKGNIIFPFSIMENNAIVGDYNILTSYSFISHDCVVGNNNFFSTAGIAGNVKLGNDNFFGLRSTVIPGIEIGNNNIIQAGMTIDKNIKDNTTVFYKYKEKIFVIGKK